MKMDRDVKCSTTSWGVINKTDSAKLVMQCPLNGGCSLNGKGIHIYLYMTCRFESEIRRKLVR